MTDGKLHIGYSMENGEPILLPVKTLKRHFAALGSSGSGKTVFVKAVLEECIREEIPLLLIDIQGDLASLALMGDRKLVEEKGTPGSYYDEIKEKAQVAIYTPASTKGIPISMNPLKAPPKNMEAEDIVQTLDTVAETITSLIGYSSDKGKGTDVHSYLYLLLEAIWEPKNGERIEINKFEDLIEIIYHENDYLTESQISMLDEKEKTKVIKKLRSLTIGADSLIFNLGIPLDIKKMMTWQDKGKVPVNVLYLNTIRDEMTRKNFMADVATQTYNYMLQNPSKKVQLVLLFDELAGLVPPIGNPPTKKSIQLLLKQARKYGISMLLATQNISDVDYKSLGQVGTWALGRLMAKQDIEKVRAIIEAISPTEVDKITTKIRSLKTGQFMLLAPDVYDDVQYMRVRWLTTDHTTLDDDRVKQITDEAGIRAKFNLEEKKETDKKSEPDLEEKQENEPAEIEMPTIQTLEDIPSFLEEHNAAMNIDQIAAHLGKAKSSVSSTLNKLVKSKQLKAESIEKEDLYWSPKSAMDPKNNLVGPFFKLGIKIIRGKAEKIVEDEIPKDLFKKREKILKHKTQHVDYLPLWRIPIIQLKEKSNGLFRKEVVEETIFYYLNAMTGELLDLDGKKKDYHLKFADSGIEDIETVQTLPNKLQIQPLTLDDLDEAFYRPEINREMAKKITNSLIGGRINNKVPIALVFYPIWYFIKKDKDTEETIDAWVDAIYGTYFDEENNPV